MTVRPVPFDDRRPRPVPEPVEPGLLSRALDVAGRLANDAAEVISATPAAGPHGARPGPKAPVRLGHRHRPHPRTPYPSGAGRGVPVGPGRRRDTRRRGAAPYRGWVVAPVDGAANYVAGLPWCAYSLALVDGVGPAVGVIADPGRGQIYAAGRGRGFRANGVPVRRPGRPGWRAPGLRGGPVGGFRGRVRDARGRAGARLGRAGGHPGRARARRRGRAGAVPRLGRRRRALPGAEAGAVVVDRDGRPDPMPAGGLLVAMPPVLDDVYRLWAAASR